MNTLFVCYGNIARSQFAKAFYVKVSWASKSSNKPRTLIG